jgi:hypothetical protein
LLAVCAEEAHSLEGLGVKAVRIGQQVFSCFPVGQDDRHGCEMMQLGMHRTLLGVLDANPFLRWSTGFDSFQTSLLTQGRRLPEALHNQSGRPACA